MEQAAKELDFINAAQLSDEIKGYQTKLETLKGLVNRINTFNKTNYIVL